MNGIALTVLISPQLPKLFGFSIEGGWSVARAMGNSEKAVLNGKKANWVAFAVGAGTLAVILVREELPAAYPEYCLPWLARPQQSGVFPISLRVPACRSWVPFRKGCRHSTIPWINSYADIGPVVTGGLACRARVVRRHECAFSRVYAARDAAANVDPNQEMVGTRSCPIWLPDSFQGFPISSSSSRASRGRSCRRSNSVDRSSRCF